MSVRDVLGRVVGVLAWLRGVAGIALYQLTHARSRILLAITGVAAAVFLITLMTGLGYGMTQAGTEALTYIDQDLWASAGPLELAPGTVGGVQNSMVDAHDRQREIHRRGDVDSAAAIAFQSVYISRSGEEYDTVVGVGVTGNGSEVGLNDDAQFDRADVHYANGSYDGPMTHTVVLDRNFADRLNVSVGDTVHMGGTLASAQNNEFTVVGTSGRFSTFLGAPTAVVHLSELQTVTGTSGGDRASMLGIRVVQDADPGAVATDLERSHPELTIRTQQEQFRTVFENQGVVLASAVTLVVLALVIGTGLVANTLGLVVYQQRREFAALLAVGVRARTLLTTVGLQGLVLATGGIVVGVLVTPVAARRINLVVEDLVGFAELIKLPPTVYTTGIAVGLLIGVVGAAVAGWRLVSMNPTVYLDE